MDPSYYIKKSYYDIISKNDETEHTLDTPWFMHTEWNNLLVKNFGKKISEQIEGNLLKKDNIPLKTYLYYLKGIDGITMYEDKLNFSKWSPILTMYDQLFKIKNLLHQPPMPPAPASHAHHEVPHPGDQ